MIDEIAGQNDYLSIATEAARRTALDLQIRFTNPSEVIYKYDEEEDNEFSPPEIFDYLRARLKGLVVKMKPTENGLMVWELHFGVGRVDTKEEAAALGFNEFHTFAAFIDDMKTLKEMMKNNPQIKPDVVYAGMTNDRMIAFIEKVFPELVLGKVGDSNFLTKTDPGWEDEITLIDIDKWFAIVDELSEHDTFLSMYRSRRKKTRNLG